MYPTRVNTREEKLINIEKIEGEDKEEVPYLHAKNKIAAIVINSTEQKKRGGGTAEDEEARREEHIKKEVEQKGGRRERRKRQGRRDGIEGERII